jgi:hypothetical protein
VSSAASEVTFSSSSAPLSSSSSSLEVPMVVVGALPPGYVFCADEGDLCDPPMGSDVAYGANDSYTYKTNIADAFTVGLAFFGVDPAPNVLKSVYYRVPDEFIDTLPSGFLFCGNELDTCILPNLANVAYGAAGGFTLRYNLTGSVLLSNQVFGGDPAPNQLKSGYYKTVNSSLISNSNLLSDGTFSAGQGQFGGVAANGTITYAGEVAIAIDVLPENPWSVELTHPVDLLGGAEYSLCFDAKTSEASREIFIDLDGVGPGYLSLTGVDQVVTLTQGEDYRSYHQKFTISDSAPGGRVQFKFGSSDADVQLDNIGLYLGAACGNPANVSSVTEVSCRNSEWICIDTPLAEPYGAKTFEVPAVQSWVNTGLYLTAGQTAIITPVSGEWNVNALQPDIIGDFIDHGPCRIGDMVARIGLHYKDQMLTCVNNPLTLTADKDGILFLGALPGNDLGETYHSRNFASGKRTVRVVSEGQTVPTIKIAELANYPIDQVASGTVEILGEHTVLTLPTSVVKRDLATLPTAVSTLDEIYNNHAVLRGAVPHNGLPIRFYPDGTNPGYLLAGNPVRMQLELLTNNDRVSIVGQPGTNPWGYAHELGHDFTFIGANWTYQENLIESWTNIFTLYSFEKLGFEPLASFNDCDINKTGADYPNYIDYTSMDPASGLCFLRQFQLRYGFDFYQRFFVELNKANLNRGISNWSDVHDVFESLAGEDITPIFDAWGVPH